MTRTDPHRLQVLDPAEYHSVGFEDMHEEEGMVEVDLDDCQDFVRNYRERKLIGDVWVIVGGTNYSDSEAYRYLIEHLEDDANYGCRICGQAHGNRYWYYFQHEPTGDVIRVGSKCAIMVGLGTREELEDRRAHERREIAVLRGKWLNGDPVHKRVIDWAWSLIPEDTDTNSTGTRLVYKVESFESQVAGDFLAYFNREGMLSYAQVNFAMKLIKEAPEKRAREEKIAKEKEEEPEAAPVIEGKVEIVGKIIGLDWKHNDFGTRAVMTVLDDRGFKVWGTRPSAFPLNSVERGTRVSFNATVEVSDRDETFGFFKRPTKAKILEEVAG